MKLLLKLGANKDNIVLVDRKGVVHSERDDLSIQKQFFSINTNMRTLEDAMCDADVLIGVSGPDLVSAQMLKSMSAKPIVFALSNPDPEIEHSLALSTRNDLIMATGRSDYANQVNNVLGFPYIFRGALDVRADIINDEMKIAASQRSKH
jgi:malate dehydrogenase (oxaloacetate-decarboxylating)(NADP+)